MENNFKQYLTDAAPLFPSLDNGDGDPELARRRMGDAGLRLQLLLIVRELRTRGVSLDAGQDRELIEGIFAMLPLRKSRQLPRL